MTTLTGDVARTPADAGARVGEPPLAARVRGVFGDRAIALEVWRLAWPAILHMLLITVAFVASRIIVGRHSAAALASLQIGSVVVWTLYSLLTALGAGTLAVVARSVGAGDLAGARAAARSALGFAVVLGTLVGVLASVFAAPLLHAMYPRVDAEVLEGAVDYLRLTSLALPFAFVEAVGAAAVQGAGNTRLPLVVAGLGNVFHVGLSYALVFGHFGLPALGLRGAAIGSASTMIVEGVLLGAVVLSGRVRGLATRGAPLRAALRRVLDVSGPAYAEKGVYHLGYGLFMAILGLLGANALAANQALMSIEAVSFLTADGFGVAAAAIVAQKLGAKREDLSTQAGWIAAELTTMALTALGLLFVAAPRLLMAPFTTEPALLDLGARTLGVAAIAQPFMGFATVMAMSLRGAGDTRSVLLVTFAGSLVARPVATWLFAVTLGGGLVGLWLGSLVDWVVRAVLLGMIFAGGRWRRAKV